MPFPPFSISIGVVRSLLFVYSCILCKLVLFHFGCFIFFSKKGGPVNWHDVPVPRDMLVSSLGMARCVMHKHGRKMSSSELALATRAEWHNRASCAEKTTSSNLARCDRTARHDRAACVGFSAPISFFFPPFSFFFLTSSLSTTVKPSPPHLATPLPTQIYTHILHFSLLNCVVPS